MQEGATEDVPLTEPVQAPLVEALLTPPSSPAREVNGGAVEGAGLALASPRCASLPPAEPQQHVNVFLNTRARLLPRQSNACAAAQP